MKYDFYESTLKIIRNNCLILKLTQFRFNYFFYNKPDLILSIS